MNIRIKMSDIIKVGNIEAEKGTKVFGYLPIDDSHGTQISLPIGIVNGEKPGPTLSLTGCTQGSTYTGPETAIRLWRETDPKKLSGAIITVPVVNIPLFRAKVARRNPIDNKIIERECFPGNLDGTISDVIAYKLFNEVILNSSYHIDLRGGDLDEAEAHFMLYFITGDEKIDKELNEIAKISNFKYLYVLPITDRQRKTLGCAAREKGIISMTTMGSKGMGQYLESDILKNIEFTHNVMKYLKMIPGKVEPYPGKQYIFRRTIRKTAEHGGVWHPSVECMDEIKEGQSLGYVKDLKGDTLQTIVSPTDGFIHILRPARVVFRGDTLVTCAVTEEAWED